MNDDIRLIVGLGNPGREYERTRHNAGYWWVDAIAERKRSAWAKESKFAGWTSRVVRGARYRRCLETPPASPYRAMCLPT